MPSGASEMPLGGVGGAANCPVEVAYLDRDGTVIADVGYLRNPESVCLLPGAAEGLRMLRAGGVELAVASNQSGIGRGLFTAVELHAVNARMLALLASEGIDVEGIECCPHLPSDDCGCRKPRTGLIDRFVERRGPRRGVMIGDKASDIDCGRNAGLLTVLVLTGDGAGALLQGARPDHVAKDLREAAEWVLQLGER